MIEDRAADLARAAAEALHARSNARVGAVDGRKRASAAARRMRAEKESCAQARSAAADAWRSESAVAAASRTEAASASWRHAKKAARSVRRARASSAAVVKEAQMESTESSR